MSRYYGNNPQPRPEYFSFGNAFLGGIQNAQNNQRQNALLDMEKQQFGMQQDRHAMAVDQYGRSLQADQAAGQQAAAEREALASLLESEGLPVEWANLPRDQLADMLERHEDRQNPELMMGPDGRMIPKVEGARGYIAPKQPLAPIAAEQEYELAKRTGFQGSYLDFVKAKKESDKPPPAGPDPALQVQDAQNVLAAIDNAKGLIGFGTTGFIGQKLGGIGGTDAYDLRSALDTVKASIGFDRLQRMREESKTGGALGQVAVRELDLLQATIASLDANQSGPRLAKNLDRVQAQYEKAMRAYEAALQGEAAPGAAKPEQGGKVIDFSELPD